MGGLWLGNRVKTYFDFADWWVGFYIGDNHVYVCLLPTWVIRIQRRNRG